MLVAELAALEHLESAEVKAQVGVTESHEMEWSRRASCRTSPGITSRHGAARSLLKTEAKSYSERFGIIFDAFPSIVTFAATQRSCMQPYRAGVAAGAGSVRETAVSKGPWRCSTT